MATDTTRMAHLYQDERSVVVWGFPPDLDDWDVVYCLAAVGPIEDHVLVRPTRKNTKKAPMNVVVCYRDIEYANKAVDFFAKGDHTLNARGVTLRAQLASTCPLETKAE